MSPRPAPGVTRLSVTGLSRFRLLLRGSLNLLSLAAPVADRGSVRPQGFHGRLVQTRGRHRPLRPLIRQISLRVCAATVVQGDHASVVGRPLVGTDAKDVTQRASQRHEEAAGGAGGVGLAHAVGVRAMVAVVPTLGGTLHPLGRQHARAAEVEGVGSHDVPLLLTRGLPARFQALVRLAARQPVRT